MFASVMSFCWRIKVFGVWISQMIAAGTGGQS
jgi:hypothetical protein